MSKTLSRGEARRRRVVCEEYAKVEETADVVVSDPDVAQSFCEQVNARLNKDQHFRVAELNKLLLNLRRKGEENGGLIRKRRSFNGRNKPR